MDSDAFQTRNEAEKWFSNYIPNFHRSKIANLSLYKVSDDAFEKSNKGEEEKNNENKNRNSITAEGNKGNDGKNKKTTLPVIAEVNIGHFQILIEEN